MSQGSEKSSIIHPTLHHFGIVTRNLDVLLDWYTQVLGVSPNLRSSNVPGKVRGAWVSNDKANHRIALIESPRVKDDTDKHAHTRLQHVAFEYATIDDLLNSYTRLKGLGIEPLITVDHGPTISFYYEDPDGNTVELQVDNFGDWEKSSEFLRTFPNTWDPTGAFVDPEQLIAARQAGASLAELHQRAFAGEFPPTKPQDASILV